MNRELKRMLTGKNFLTAWLIACISLAVGATYADIRMFLPGIKASVPDMKKALECGTFISLLNGALKSQAVTFAIPVAAVLPWSDSFLQEYKSGFLKEALPRTGRKIGRASCRERVCTVV